jgi:flagellar M-ring protein FliF
VKDQLLQSLQRLWRGFLAFTPGQKAVSIAAVLALTLGGYAFSSWASKPSYAPLFTNLSPTDASGIIDKLNANKTPYQLAANGTEILVPQKQVYPLRLTMSAAGLPSSGGTGYSLLDQEGITTSEFKQHVDYQRALEGELGKTIKSINGVSDAAVHLAIPTQTVFDDGSQKPTASVLLTTMPGTTLAAGQVQSVVNLVSSSVPGLTPDQVSVSDSTGKVLSTAGDTNSAAVSDARAAATQQLETRLSTAAQDMIDKAVGSGHAVVTLNADLDYDKSNIVSHGYTYASGVPPLAVASTGESYAAGQPGSGGVLGAASPSPSAVPGASGSGGYSKNTVTLNNAVGDTTETRSNAPGNIRRLTVAVLLDKNAPQISQATVRDLVSQAVGLDPKRGDTVTVATAPFDTSAADAATKAAAKAAADASAAKRSAQLLSLVKTGGVVLLVVILVIVTLIASKRRRKPEPPDDLDAFLSTLSHDPDSLPPAPQDIIPPPSPESQQAVARQRQLAQMADNDPQEVARLLRSWLNAKEG